MIYLKFLLTFYFCSYHFLTPTQISLNTNQYLEVTNSQTSVSALESSVNIFKWSWPWDEELTALDEKEKALKVREDELNKRSERLDKREEQFNKREREKEKIIEKAGSADAWSKFAKISGIIILVLLGIIVVGGREFFKFLSSPFIKGSSLSSKEMSKGQENQSISWLQDNISPKQILEAFMNKDKLKQLPEHNDKASDESDKKGSA
jgi:hypothetical protein